MEWKTALPESLSREWEKKAPDGENIPAKYTSAKEPLSNYLKSSKISTIRKERVWVKNKPKT